MKLDLPGQKANDIERILRRPREAENFAAARVPDAPQELTDTLAGPERIVAAWLRD